MVKNKDVILKIISIVGKPVVVIYNDVESEVYTYLAKEFIQKNPGNHIFHNSISGQEISNMIKGITSFSIGSMPSDEVSVLTKLTELPIEKMDFDRFKYVVFNP